MYPEGQAARFPLDRISVHWRVGLVAAVGGLVLGHPAGPGASGNPFLGYPGITVSGKSILIDNFKVSDP